MLHDFSVWERVLDFQEVTQGKSAAKNAINWRQKILVKQLKSQLDNHTETSHCQKETNKTSHKEDWVLEQDKPHDFRWKVAIAPGIRPNQLYANREKRKFNSCWD